MLTVAIVVVLVLLVLIVLPVIRRIGVLGIRLVRVLVDSESKKRSAPSATSSWGWGNSKVPPHCNPMGGEPPSAAPVLVLSLFPPGELAASRGCYLDRVVV